MNLTLNLKTHHLKEKNEGNSNEKKVGITVLTSGKVGFGTRNITREKEEQFIIIKRSVHQENITALNACASNRETSNM